VLEPSSRKEDLARYVQISYPMQSGSYGSMHVKILTKENK
jgi:hypothetical protein